MNTHSTPTLAAVAPATTCSAGKVCKGCDQEKPLEDFPKSKVCKDGRRGFCKKCHKSKVADGLEKYRKSKRGRESNRKSCKKWMDENADHHLDRQLTRNRESREVATMNRQLWGDVEESYLLENHGKMPLMELASNLGRTLFAVRLRLYKLRKDEQNA